MPEEKQNALLKFLVGVLLLAPACRAFAQQDRDVLTHAADVISLSAERASASLKVSVTGIVTAADSALKGRFFVQDFTGGVFVDNVGGPRPEPGDLVAITGITHAGAYAPIITAPEVKKLGTAPLPAAKRVPIERLMSGAEDSQRVEVAGLVRAARMEESRLIVDLVSGGYRFRAYAPSSAAKDPQSLVAAQVRVRGTAAEAHNALLRQLIAVDLYVPGPADFVIEKPEPADPFEQPVVPLNGLAQYRRENSLIERVHVKGAVTLQRTGQMVFLQDVTGGLQVKSTQLGRFNLGDIVEAVGFPSFEGFLPVLEDAVLRAAQEPGLAVKAKPASIEELQNGLHHADFVSLQGKLIDRTIREARSGKNEPRSAKTTLVLQTENVIFTAEAEGPEGRAELGSIPIGSTLKVSGICLKDIGREGAMTALRVLIGSPRDVLVLRKPSWLTPQRLLAGLGILSVILLVIVSWTIMVSRKNSILKFLIQEREKAQVELQRAHDFLEERVIERTAQLKTQITARKESEVQSKAVLAERTRLAQELHDTLEQSLTGIALQMETSAKLFNKNPNGANHHLELAMNLMSQSQVEVRRSIWDLRCRALEQFDLPGALRLSSRQIIDGTRIHVQVAAKGRVRPLPEIVEDNLLRIGQEALTNIIKHSEATLAKIDLDYGPQAIVLRIEDNGKGFNPEEHLGPHEGHFGLLGVSERTKRLGGQVSLTSAPGEGTIVCVEIPLEPGQNLIPLGGTSVQPASEPQERSVLS